MPKQGQATDQPQATEQLNRQQQTIIHIPHWRDLQLQLQLQLSLGVHSASTTINITLSLMARLQSKISISS
jgi:hypothetical protein